MDTLSPDTVILKHLTNFQNSIGPHSFLIFIGFLIILILLTAKFVPETKDQLITDVVKQFERSVDWSKWPIWDSWEG